MISEGIKDGCKAFKVVFKGEKFSWNEYWIDKAITYASLALTPNSLATFTKVDSLIGAGVDVTKTIDKKFGEKLEIFYKETKKYADLFNAVNGATKALAREGLKGLGKQVLKETISLGVQKTIEEVGTMVLDNSVLSCIGDSIENFIKSKCKSIIESVFSGGKKLFQILNCALSLSNKRNLKDRLYKINDTFKNIKSKNGS